MTTAVLAYLPSPAQGVWHLGPLPIRAYALCILVGIVAALVIGDRRWVARGGESGVIYDIALWAVPFGLVGGRLYHVITDWTTYFGADGKGFDAALRIWDGGLGIWGAVALGGVGAWIACRRRGIPLPAFGDAIAPGIVLAQAIGRLGNYFNQELYGHPTTLPWGLEVYERRNAAGALDSLNGVSTGRLIEVYHPTFLYELLWNLLVFAVLIWADRRFKIGHGRVFALYVAGYCVGRFWIELMRSDYATTIADTGIRVNTFTSTFVFIGAVVYIMLAPKGRDDPASLKGNDYDTDSDEAVLDEVGEELAAIGATSGVVAAAKVAGASDETDEHESEAAAEAEELTEEVATAPSEDIVEAEAFAAAGAAADADEAHLDAESLEPDVATEDSEELDSEEVDVDAAEPAPEEGLGSVETDEVAEATDEAAEVHEAAAEPAPEEGLGSVESDEVAEATGEAAEVHEAAVEGEREAELLAEDVATESDAVEDTADAEDTDTQTEASENDEPVVDGESGTAEDTDSDDTDAAEPAPEEGLGSVEGDEVAEATDEAAEVHEAAVEGEREAESLAENVATESGAAEDIAEAVAVDEDAPEASAVALEGTEVAEALEAEPEPEPEPEAGLGSVEGDEVAEAQDDAAEVHEAAVEGEREAESLADDVVTEDDAAVDDAPARTEKPTDTPAQPVAEESRRRWWRRRK